MATSPPPSRSSPPRQPLHERSESHTNKVTSPSLRIIGNPGAPVYPSTPFPTHPSHILSPKIDRRQGLAFDDGFGVSQEDSPPFDREQDPPDLVSTTTSRSEERAGSNNIQHGRNAQSSTTDFTLPDIQLAQHSGQATGADINADDPVSIMDQGIDDGERLSDEIVQLPSLQRRADTLGLPSFTPAFDAATQNLQGVGAKSSDTSLSSAESTGTVVRPQNRNRLPRGSYSAFPTSYSGYSNSSRDSFSTSARPNTRGSEERGPPASAGSSSLSGHVFPDRVHPDGHRTSSSPMYARIENSSDSDVSLQFPVIRAPTASGSWAESSSRASNRSQRTFDRQTHRWNPHLSTVESEETPDLSNFPTPPPVPPYNPRRNITDSTIRVVNERDDNVGDMLSPVPGSRDSTFQSVFSRDSYQDNRRGTLQTRPGTRGSFLRDSIPAWARSYYARSTRESLPPASPTDAIGSRPPTNPSSEDDASPGLYRPRNRPNEMTDYNRNRDSMTITQIRPSGITLQEIRGQPRRKGFQTWSPHLWHDRTARRRSRFQEPSLDNDAEGNAVNKRTAQIFLFTVGFIFPLAWFIASFLPLPQRPPATEKRPAGHLDRPPGGKDLAQDIESALGPVDQARYDNAKWWRTLNRLMSIVGVLIVCAIIALAVVAVHVKN